MSEPRARAFTLVELLVVITIIVALMAILAPAMDRAIYRAELAACAARLKAHGTTALTYAMDFRRHYLYRAAIMDATPYRPDYLALTGPNVPNHDDRPALRPYMALNKLMACPFVKEVEFDQAEKSAPVPAAKVLLYTSYAYWYGWRFATSADQTQPGMYKLGDRFVYDGVSFNVLACDTDIIQNGGFVNDAHPETKDPVLGLFTERGNGIPNPVVASYPTFSYWASWTNFNRGPVDRNFAFDDGSVRGIDDLALDKDEWNDMVIDDKRVVPVPGFTPEADVTAYGYHTWLPPQ